VRDAVALIGFIFHWPPDWCFNQRVSDLMAWRDRATALYKAAHSEPDS
jgi:hypothetical protein